ncbi:hypothetical protein HOD88_01710 [archaeon]|jgi:hypothetical protein|nr:hypothetical protein [archaeon]
MQLITQLREELYAVAKRKLVLEEEMKTMNFYLSTLKKELDFRMPAA